MSPAGAAQQKFDRLAAAVEMIRFGSEAYATAMLAAGHIDLCFEPSLLPYDIVALGGRMDRRAADPRACRGHAGDQESAVVCAEQPRDRAGRRTDADGPVAAVLQSAALRSYTLEGPFGWLLDAAEDDLAIADVQRFETEALMGQGRRRRAHRSVPPARGAVRRAADPARTRRSLDLPLPSAVRRAHLRMAEDAAQEERRGGFATNASPTLPIVRSRRRSSRAARSASSRSPNDRAIEPQSRQAIERFGLTTARSSWSAALCPSGNSAQRPSAG